MQFQRAGVRYEQSAQYLMRSGPTLSRAAVIGMSAEWALLARFDEGGDGGILGVAKLAVRRWEAFDGLCMKSNRQECVPNAREDRQINPLATVRAPLCE